MFNKTRINNMNNIINKIKVPSNVSFNHDSLLNYITLVDHISTGGFGTVFSAKLGRSEEDSYEKVIQVMKNEQEAKKLKQFRKKIATNSNLPDHFCLKQEPLTRKAAVAKYQYLKDGKYTAGFQLKWIPILFNRLTNFLVTESICINFPLYYADFVSDSCKFVDLKTKNTKSCVILLQEMQDYDLKIWAKDSRSEDEWLICYAQILLTIHCIQHYFKGVHRDIYWRNILVRRIPKVPGYIEYKIGDRLSFYLPNIGYLFLVADFDKVFTPYFHSPIKYMDINNGKIYQHDDPNTPPLNQLLPASSYTDILSLCNSLLGNYKYGDIDVPARSWNGLSKPTTLIKICTFIKNHLEKYRCKSPFAMAINVLKESFKPFQSYDRAYPIIFTNNMNKPWPIAPGEYIKELQIKHLPVKSKEYTKSHLISIAKKHGIVTSSMKKAEILKELQNKNLL